MSGVAAVLDRARATGYAEAVVMAPPGPDADTTGLIVECTTTSVWADTVAKPAEHRLRAARIDVMVQLTQFQTTNLDDVD